MSPYGIALVPIVTRRKIFTNFSSFEIQKTISSCKNPFGWQQPWIPNGVHLQKEKWWYLYNKSEQEVGGASAGNLIHCCHEILPDVPPGIGCCIEIYCAAEIIPREWLLGILLEGTDFTRIFRILICWWLLAQGWSGASQKSNLC